MSRRPPAVLETRSPVSSFPGRDSPEPVYFDFDFLFRKVSPANPDSGDWTQCCFTCMSTCLRIRPSSTSIFILDDNHPPPVPVQSSSPRPSPAVAACETSDQSSAAADRSTLGPCACIEGPLATLFSPVTQAFRPPDLPRMFHGAIRSLAPKRRHQPSFRPSHEESK